MHQAEKTDRFAAVKVSLLKAFSPSVPTFGGQWLGGKCAESVLLKSESYAKSALFFRGVAFDLLMEQQHGETTEHAELVRVIDTFVETLSGAESTCKQVISKFRTRNPSSQVALAFEEMTQALENLRSSVVSLRTVATGGSIPGLVFPVGNSDSWETAVQHQREAFASITARVHARDTSDIDSDLLALAGEAIAASDVRNLADDADWARRLSQSPLH